MKYDSLFKKGKMSICMFLLLLVIGCSIVAIVFPHGTMFVEGLVSGTGSITSGNGTSLNSGVNLSKISSMNNVACSQMWQNLVADGAGYTMVNALQSPDGSCVVDFMDTDGLFYTETWSSQNNGVVSTPTPASANISGTPTPAPASANIIGGIVQSGQRTIIHEI